MGETSLLILYGSQTGNSREVSKELCEKAVAKGYAARARLGCMVRQGYGMTEAAPATHVVPYERTDDANGAVGTLLPGMECKIVSTETGEAVVATRMIDCERLMSYPSRAQLAAGQKSATALPWR